MQLFRTRWIPLITLLLLVPACSGIGPQEASAPRELSSDVSAGEIHNAFLEEMFRTPQLRDPATFEEGLEEAFVALGRNLELSDEDSRLLSKITAMALDSLENANLRPFSFREEDQLDLLRVAAAQRWIDDGDAEVLGNWVKRLSRAEDFEAMKVLLHEQLPAEAESPTLKQALDLGQHSLAFWSGAHNPAVTEEMSYEEALEAMAEFNEQILMADIVGGLVASALVVILMRYGGGALGAGGHMVLQFVLGGGASVCSYMASQAEMNPAGRPLGHGVGWHGEGNCH